ncbi:hypothetical protein [Hydrogenovibrio halophilus]|uniref:hypothetical protein n=1 Tax=Hydrogenovibrio halophilus TaxID=373391 RepID=UPI0003A12ECB|nr:hypothetical protein [Hydrogenovibrio halophilus]
MEAMDIWTLMAVEFFVLGSIILLFSALMISLKMEEDKAAREEREQKQDWPSKREVGEMQITNLWLRFAQVAGLVVLMLFTAYQIHAVSQYEYNTGRFVEWIETTYEVSARTDQVHRVECYVGVLHYPQKNDSGLLPYAGDPKCDAVAFEQKKRQLGMDGTYGRLLLSGFFLVIGWLSWLVLLGYSANVFMPQYQWALGQKGTSKTARKE